jgi:small-conductance mechanosensitive channel
VAVTPDLALLERVRDVLANRPVTETELRILGEQIDGLVRVLGAQLDSSEARLTQLADQPASSLTGIADELHRVEALRPRLEEARSLLNDLETRARELRTSWLIHQADNPLRP